MTRGPLPLVAIRQAIRNAAERGTVVDRDVLQKSRADFLLFCTWITVFVRVRRSPQYIVSPAECAERFRADLHLLHRIPATRVMARELWLLLPWDTWQYFRITDDGVVEIRADGAPFIPDRAGQPDPVLSAERRTGEPASTGDLPPGGDP